MKYKKNLEEFHGKKSLADSYPNAMAHIIVSMPQKTIERIDDGRLNNMAKNRSADGTDFEHRRESNSAIEAIWKNLAIGRIDLSFACVGYTLDGRLVLDHNNVIDMLIGYGFKPNDIFDFIDDYEKSSAKDSNAPIIMTNINSARISTEIEPLEDSEDANEQENKNDGSKKRKNSRKRKDNEK